MICRKGRRPDLPPEVIRNSILDKARRHFSEHGFQGASLKAIAKDCGVAGSLINYHFKDKDGLFKACCEIFARSRTEAMNRLLAEPHNRDELRVRLEMFIEEMFQSILDDPHGFEMLQREMRAGNAAILKLFQETLLVSFQNVVKFFEQAAANGLLREGSEPMIVASLLFTTASEMANKDFMARKFFSHSLAEPEWRKKVSNQIMSLFFNGVVK